MTLKLLLPWEEEMRTISSMGYTSTIGVINIPVRKNINGKIIASIGFNLDGNIFSNITQSQHKNEKIAIEETDKKLLEDGYTLLTQEQAEKYKILL